MHAPRSRSTLPKAEARQRYVEMGELAALQQIRKDSKALDQGSIPIGPFARLDAGAVAAQDGKTRGAITNLFGSQAAFQSETMALTLSAEGWVENVEFPAAKDFATAEAWLDALLTGESARGPRHGSKPVLDYGFLWALWLSTVTYGLWSERIRDPSMDEHVQLLHRLEQIIQEALDHFDLRLRADTSVRDLACAIATTTEGVWLNQCLTAQHPTDPTEPIATVLRRAGRLLWRGAIA